MRKEMLPPISLRQYPLHVICCVIGCLLVLAAASSSGQITSVDSVSPLSYRVSITPDIGWQTFHGLAEIDINVRKPLSVITMNAKDLAFDSVAIKGTNDNKLLASFNDSNGTVSFQLSQPLSVGRHTLVISYLGHVQQKHAGMFRVRYVANGDADQMLATQFEPSGAHLVFPCWDEPTAKATFVLSAIVPAGNVAVSNTSVMSEVPAGRDSMGLELKRVTFQKTKRMSPYLLALIVGNLETVSAMTGNRARVGVWTPKGRVEEGRASLEYAEKLLPLYGKFLQFRYPLSKLDMVAVPHLGFDAMENWGAITFEQDLLLDDLKTAPESNLRAVRHLVGHEVAHQWFGDLVTASSWDEVWLNESLSEWMSYKATELLTPREEPWLNFHTIKTRAMDWDTENTKPIMGNGFDASVAYRKGPAVLRMIELYLGEKAFQRGLQSYLRNHAYGNVTTRELWMALHTASGEDVSGIGDTFVKQSGFPLVTVSTYCDQNKTSVTLSQRPFGVGASDPRQAAWTIPVAIGSVEKNLTNSHIVVLGSKPQNFIIDGCGTAIKANVGDSGYYRVLYDSSNWALLVNHFAALPVLDRADLLNDEWSLVRQGLSDAASYFDLTQQLSGEKTLIVWASVIETLRQIDSFERGSPEQPEFRAYARSLLKPVMQEVGWDANANESPGMAALRPLLIAALGEFQDKEVIAESKKRFEADHIHLAPLPADTREAILETIGRNADSQTYDDLQELARGSTSNELKKDFYRALASVQDPLLLDRTIAMTKNPELQLEEAILILVTAAQRSDPDRVWFDIQKDRQTILNGKLPSGLLEAIAEHAFSTAVGDSLLADPAFATTKKQPHAVAKIQLQADLRLRVVGQFSKWVSAQQSVIR